MNSDGNHAVTDTSTRSHSRKLCASLILILLGLTIDQGPCRADGDDKNDKMTIAGILLRRIVSGTLPLVDRAKPNEFTDPANDVPIEEFWIAETELSQQQYLKIQQGRLPLPLPHLEMLRQRSEFRDSQEVIDLFDQSRSGGLPVFGLTASEAIVICAALNQSVSNHSSLVSGSFRLPTEFEWQYAVRGVESRQDRQAEDRLHVALWPDNPKDWLRTEEQRRSLRINEIHWHDFKDAIGIPSVSPENKHLKTRCWVRNLLDPNADPMNASRRSAILGVWRAVWKDSKGRTLLPFGLQDIEYGQQAGIPACDPEERLRRESFQDVNSGGTSHWGLKNVHGNASEWCVSRKSQPLKLTSASATWDELRHTLGESKVSLCGGSSGDRESDWEYALLWRFRELEPNLYDSPKNAFAYTPGIRLVWSVSGIADDWIVQISYRARQSGREEFLDWAGRQRSELLGTADNSERSRVLATLSFYESLASQSGTGDRADILASNIPDADTADYFKKLATLNAPD